MARLDRSCAHRRITGNDSVEHCGKSLRKDHAFAPAGGAADEVGVRGRLCVVLRDDVLGNSGDLGVGEEGEVEVSLLVAHEGEVEGAGLGLVACIGAGDGKAARECRLVAGVVRSRWIGNDAVTASPALHHEVAVPGRFIGECKSKANAKLLAIDALAAMDHPIDAAVRGQRADGGSVRIRRRHCCAGGNELGPSNLDVIELEASEVGAGVR